ncbi:MAG TPA: hypothetical protein VFV38_33020 [Ktedonobacteraceae bacterium]|nr:hypothetical protein [Ktedonobacteraceae bacterium]
MVEKSHKNEEQSEVPHKLTLAEKMAEAMIAIDEEHIVHEYPTSPSASPGGRRRGRKPHYLGTVVIKKPFI